MSFNYFKITKNRLTVRKALIENTVKHFLVVIITFLLHSSIYTELENVKMANLSDFLTIISILLVTVCFANFASSYEITDIKGPWMRMLSQIASFFFLILIALLLETMVLAIQLVFPGLYRLSFWFTIILYMGIVLYDYWDFVRCFTRKPEYGLDHNGFM